MDPKPKDVANMKTGFTTGACSAAAAQAACRFLVTGQAVKKVLTTIPNGQKVEFEVLSCVRDGFTARAVVVKDGGDDPDCTHGAHITATVCLSEEKGVRVEGGEGVARVTLPGLGIEVGGPAITRPPLDNIRAMVEAELAGGTAGADVVISVPGGLEMAKKTINERLGLIGGISILGTTGIVYPYSTAAFRTSVVNAIDVAHAQGLKTICATTGGKSERYAMDLYPEMHEMAFIQVGDFVGTAVSRAVKKGMNKVIIAGMIGKLSKMADGKVMTHAAGSQVNMGMLADMAAEAGAPEAVVGEIRRGVTARNAMEVCEKAGFADFPSVVCRGVTKALMEHAKHAIEITAIMTDFDGKLIGKDERKP